LDSHDTIRPENNLTVVFFGANTVMGYMKSGVKEIE
jgi:hypothetical protein